LRWEIQQPAPIFWLLGSPLNPRLFASRFRRTVGTLVTHRKAGVCARISITTLAEVVRDEINPALDIEYTEARDGDAEHTHADISKATELIGYEPSRDIREGVAESIE